MVYMTYYNHPMCSEPSDSDDVALQNNFMLRWSLTEHCHVTAVEMPERSRRAIKVSYWFLSLNRRVKLRLEIFPANVFIRLPT